MLTKLLQHLLIWLAASATIVLGMRWGYALGFTSHRPEMQALAWTAASGTLVFAAALVQRAPAAILALVVLCSVLFVAGSWLLAGGARTAGLGYMAIGATYVIGLGPSCIRWIRGS